MEMMEHEAGGGQSQVVALAGQDASSLEDLLRRGARQLLLKAVEAEVEDYIARHGQLRDSAGHRLVTRNGHARERTIVSGLGPIKVRAPRVEDRRRDASGNKLRFSSTILPPYLRKTKSVEELIPWLYLKGISTGDFTEALSALLGPECPGLSASTVVRLKEQWSAEYATWSKRSLQEERYVYLWADGIYCNVRLVHGHSRNDG